MASWSPKLIYNAGAGNVTITFDSQPEGDPYNEVLDPEVKVTRSSNGTRQVQYNYTTKRYDLKFKFQSTTTYIAFVTFLNAWGFKGGSFNYYPSADEVTYETMQLVIGSVKFSRPVFDGSDFEYDFGFSIEAVQ